MTYIPGVSAGGGPSTIRTGPEESDTFYVDSINGDDENDGLAPESAFQSIAAAMAVAGTVYRNGAQLLVHLAGGGGFHEEATSQANYSLSTSIRMPTGGAAEDDWVGGFNPSVMFRGPRMVPATGLTSSFTVAGAASSVLRGPDGATVSGTGLRVRITASSSPGWSNEALVGFYLRGRRNSDDAIAFPEIPISTNGSNWLVVDDTDVHTFFQTRSPQNYTWEIVTCGAVISDQANIVGADDIGCDVWSGVRKVFERIGFQSTVRTPGYVGLSFDRCMFWSEFQAIGSSAPVMVNCIGRNTTRIAGSLWTSTDPRPFTIDYRELETDPTYAHGESHISSLLGVFQTIYFGGVVPLDFTSDDEFTGNVIYKTELPVVIYHNGAMSVSGAGSFVELDGFRGVTVNDYAVYVSRGATLVVKSWPFCSAYGGEGSAAIVEYDGQIWEGVDFGSVASLSPLALQAAPLYGVFTRSHHQIDSRDIGGPSVIRRKF